MKRSFFKTLFDRRSFLKVFSLSALASLLPNKASGLSDYRNDKNIPKKYIQNRDKPGFHIRSANPFLGVDLNSWALVIGGQVEKTVAFSYEDLFGFRMISQVSRLKCVECWSAKATWEGFHFEELLKKVRPHPEAKYVYFQSADSYYESFSLEELKRPRVLFVLRMNGNPLSQDHGFPLRLIAPFKYGYKNVKYITRMEFTDTRKRNYWANNGPYSVDGTIQPGIDHPLDFKKKPLPINGAGGVSSFRQTPLMTLRPWMVFCLGFCLFSCGPPDVEQIAVSIPKGVVVPEDMIYIPEGGFVMGHADDPRSEGGSKVVTDAFFIDRYEVSRGAFQKFRPEARGFRKESPASRRARHVCGSSGVLQFCGQASAERSGMGKGGAGCGRSPVALESVLRPPEQRVFRVSAGACGQAQRMDQPLRCVRHGAQRVGMGSRRLRLCGPARGRPQTLQGDPRRGDPDASENRIQSYLFQKLDGTRSGAQFSRFPLREGRALMARRKTL